MDPQHNNNEHTPESETMPHSMRETGGGESGVGPTAGIIIIILLLLLGGWYFWSESRQERDAPLPVIPADDTDGTDTTSNSASNLEAELEANNLEALEAQMEADMQALEEDFAE